MSTQIKRWKWNWLGHTLRKGHEAIEREALDWNPQGKRRRVRPRQMWQRTVHNEVLEKAKSCSEVKRMAGNRTRWRCFVDVLCPLRDNRNWWWWWQRDEHGQEALCSRCFTPEQSSLWKTSLIGWWKEIYILVSETKYHLPSLYPVTLLTEFSKLVTTITRGEGESKSPTKYNRRQCGTFCREL
jgi:hypothetical protein